MTQNVGGPIDTLFDTLNGFVQNFVFTLTEAQATQHAWTSVASLLTSYAPNSTLTIDGANATPHNWGNGRYGAHSLIPLLDRDHGAGLVERVESLPGPPLAHARPHDPRVIDNRPRIL